MMFTDNVGVAEPADAANTVAATEHAGAHSAENVPFYAEAEFWVGLGFILFLVLLIYKKVPAAAAGALDGRTAKIKHDLDEAARLRSEAEALLQRATDRLAQASSDAVEIVSKAERAGDLLATQAAHDLETIIARRSKAAEDRIAVAVRAAETELREQAVDLATHAARTVIAADTTAKDQSRLTMAAIAELGERLN